MWPKANFDQIFKFHFLKIWETNSTMCTYRQSFNLNGHITGFRPQTQKLESPYKTLSNFLAVKGLRRWKNRSPRTEIHPSEQRREPTSNSTHVWRCCRDLNPGHIGGRRVLSPLRHHFCPKSEVNAKSLFLFVLSRHILVKFINILIE